jgi:hypothetical protein
MKKLLSTITAISLLAASSAGLSVNAAGFDLKAKLFSEETTAALAAAATPTVTPTQAPTLIQTVQVTEKPTATPTTVPTEKPTATPTTAPTQAPTTEPTATAAATEAATSTPEATATAVPTETPTAEPTTAPTGLKGIALNKESLTLKKGESFKLEAETEPAGAEANIVWSSANDCVTVSNDGTVKAVSAGTAIVSAIAEGKYVASCYITAEDESGILNMSVSEGVKEVVVTRNGVSTEVNAGENTLEAGTYAVSAKSEEGYTLNTYAENVTINKNQETKYEISAEKTSCTVSIPSVAGVTITPVNGSKSPVELNGSYSFTVSLGGTYQAENLVVKANGTALTAKDDVYTIENIKDDVVITIDGVESKSWDASLKSVTVKSVEAVLGSNNVYSVTLPYGETIKVSDITVVPNDSKSEYTVTTVDGVYTITVKAEDGTQNIYKVNVSNAAATSIDEFKLAIGDLKFSDVTQSSSGSYDSQETVKAAVEAKIKSIADSYPSVTYTVENGEVKAPVKGTLTSTTGEDGYYRFTITLSEKTSDTAEAETRTIPVEIKVNCYNYVISASNITVTTTTMTIKNVDSSSEIALFTTAGGKLRSWVSPTNGTVTFSNLTGGETYVVKVRAAGSTEVPTKGTSVTMKESKSRRTSRYYTVTFDEGDHGSIVSGKAKQTVKLTGIPDYPTIKADDGYIFKGWSSNGVLVENPKTYFIRSATSFTAIYEKSSGSTYSTSTSRNPSQTTTVQSAGTTVVNTFYDVASSSWYYNSVTDICKKGYMNGTSNGMFEPESTLTRAMLVTILYRYACEPNVDTAATFTDVQSGTWYSDAVAWAADAGIVNGVTDDTFDPNADITREQLAAIMYRYSDAFGYDISASGNIIKYNDSSQISDWAQTALIWTTGSGIIDGKDNNRLDPQGKATRAEAATIIERFDSYINS